MSDVSVGSPPRDSGFLVACLCAEWCGSCREYRADFDALALQYPDTRFVWVDVEDEPELTGDIDIENFPTLVIQRQIVAQSGAQSHVLFCGAMQPYIRQLDRLIQTLMAQTPAESLAYAISSPERNAWQQVADIRSRLALHE